MLLKKSREIAPEGKRVWVKREANPIADVPGGESEVQCYKGQCCIGTCNVRSMNQSKLEVVKQDIARVNIDILGINELKWPRMG